MFQIEVPFSVWQNDYRSSKVYHGFIDNIIVITNFQAEYRLQLISFIEIYIAYFANTIFG